MEHSVLDKFVIVTYHAAWKAEFQPPIGRVHSWRFSIFNNIVSYVYVSCDYSVIFAIRQFAAWVSTVITHKHSQKEENMETKKKKGCLLLQRKLRPRNSFPYLLSAYHRSTSLFEVLLSLFYPSSFSYYIAVVVVFTLNRSFYPTTSAVPPVSFLILHPREIQIMWSQTVRQKKNKPR